jgi:RNA polymerase sigma factor (sigma-70 family)
LKRSFLDSVLRGAEALAARDGVGTLPDPDLVRRFAAGRDPAAFAVLVRRHGPLVWGVCRNLLPADADAEDAFQATFLALVRSAAGIRRTESLAGWLHGVAYRVAMKARRAAARRKNREVVAAVPEPTSPVPDAAWDELQAAVHEEVCKLPDKLRLPFVLCGLQGRPQKEAAKVLGWKVGTVSGRLTEARRRLLDRLARRGVPVGVAVGAAVLGGVAGRAAVPSVLSGKVLSLTGSPAGVSHTVLSLARGVTPMYLTRTKLLAAGLVLVGVLTTGVGVLSRADAQAAPPKSYADELKKYYDALRSHEAPKDRWEYKFIPVDKLLTTADLRKVLAGADQEGWSYCGSQELAEEKTGKISQHMVFKRPRAGAVADEDRARRVATELEALGAREAAAQRSTALEKERAALLEQLKLQDAELAKRKAEADRAIREFERARKLADEQAASDRSTHDAAARAMEEAAKQRAQAEEALRDAAKARDLDARLKDQERQKQIEELKAKYEERIRQLEAELKKWSTPSGGKGPPQADASNPFRSAAGQPRPDETITAVVKLRHIDGKTAAAALGKVLPQAKIIAEVSPDSIMLNGPGTLVMEGREIIQMKLDVPADGKAPPAGATGDKIVVERIPLKHIEPQAAMKIIDKLTAGSKVKVSVTEVMDNVLALTGPASIVADLKRILGELDQPAK